MFFNQSNSLSERRITVLNDFNQDGLPIIDPNKDVLWVKAKSKVKANRFNMVGGME